ncbi:hypothetical protein IV203_021169 [Nitzschia inconspicua]|uniref:Uncharacterized protein n=1 Tax=Nitzschia inconspicua TaxID=303405 RepID=A0A9K3KHL3_9STRA|nr:hypothetical protein IV203_021169 [Nitzschia inconspicua]
MTTQVLIYPLSLSIMGDNNNNDATNSSSMNLPPTNSQLLMGRSERSGSDGASAAYVAPARSTKAAVTANASVSQEGSSLSILSPETTNGTMSNPASLNPKSDAGSLESFPSATGVADSFAAAAAATSPPAVGSHLASAGTRDTDIVSHLRRSSSLGSSRQDIEMARKARDGNTEASYNHLGNATANPSSIVASTASSMMPANGFGSVVGGGGNAMSNQMAAALFLQGQIAAMRNNTSNSCINGMMMPHPNMLMAAAGFGMGNFGNLAALAVGKPGSVLDPRLGGAFFGGSGGVTPQATKRKPLTLYMDCDSESLSEYQCLIRQQIELFEADKSEAASSVQGRNKQIVEGQVGIRCRHCAALPPRQRQKGSMYFPTKLDRIYQAAQNLSAFHLCENCKHVPENIRKRVLLLRERKSPAGGGKRYWGEGVRCLGVVEDPNGLRFR